MKNEQEGLDTLISKVRAYVECQSLVHVAGVGI